MAADAASLAEDAMRLATKFFKKGRAAWGEDFSKLWPEFQKLDADTVKRI